MLQASRSSISSFHSICPDLDQSVQPDMAVATFSEALRGEYCGNKRLERKPSGRRRVFVQTETGFVLGMELDRSDNAHTVKRKLQLALNVPTEERSLIFGDKVLKNDLSAVRNASPLLHTKNFMRRSSSTPCLSPTGKDLQVKELVKEIMKAMRVGVDPIPIHSGLEGAYYFKNCHGENVAIVKPTDEEPYAPNNPKGFVGQTLGQPGLKRSVRIGETGFREVAAYLLDDNHFANVPSTVLVKVTHSIFNVNDGVKGNKQQQRKQVSKIASLQQFIPHDFDASDYGTSSFPVAAVHRIGILDIRILNPDRHAENLLVRKLDGIGRFGQVELVPIDHGLCLPESLEDPFYEWIHWPQASIPFSEDEIESINHLDPFRDSDMLRRELPMIREACLRVLIGEMMSREFRGYIEEPSELELLCIQARSLLGDTEYLSYEVKAGDSKEFQFDIDHEEELDLTLNIGEKLEKKPICSGSRLQSLEEKEEEEETEDCEGNEFSVDEYADPMQDRVPTISKMSILPKSISVGEKSWKHEDGMQKSGNLASTSSRNRSVNEQLAASPTFVKLADLTDREWMQFLVHFQKLLCPAFANRKSGNVGQRHRQRLGTSCQF
ncbi:hypothetical protein P3X46_016299 [Hevea brasiliensis]|uniref:1-phosphatidylinositol 4-kinase n=1 Tax=Hevea brasiliensis TaxID=3981 RepID=A0ABQ9LYN7_HEVBR|nr:hypothetical protein P3X46_016299 [Hevea brasiliensis]